MFGARIKTIGEEQLVDSLADYMSFDTLSIN